MKFDVNQLNLEQIREYIEIVLAEWSIFVQDIPVEELPIQVYGVGSALALLLWYLIARVLPSPIGRISWLFLFALLCSPTVNNSGDVSQIVPACVAVVYGIVTKNMAVLYLNLTIMLSVLSVLLFLSFLWERVKTIYIDMMIDRQDERMAVYEAELAMHNQIQPIPKDLDNLLADSSYTDDFPILNNAEISEESLKNK